MPTERTVPEELLRKQYEYIDLIAARNAEAAKTSGRRPRAVAHTFGCQQNFADTQNRSYITPVRYASTRNLARLAM